MNPTTTETKAPKKPAAKRTPVAPISAPAPRTANPNKLELGDNVRSELDLNQEFLDSITEHGILIPLLVEPGLELGAYKLTDGYRRHAAALQLGLTEVPIFVGKELPDVDRIAAQLTANDQRSSISDADQVRGYQKMALFGLTADQIHKKTARPKKEIQAALTVAESAAVVDVVTDHSISLEHAAALTEFADDKKALAELAMYAEDRPSQFEHQLQRARDDRDRARLTQSLTDQLKKSKVPIVARPTSQWEGEPNKHKRIADLIDKKTGLPVLFDEHADCPGHAAFVGTPSRYGSGPIDIQYVCTNPSKYGHRDSSRGPAPAPATSEQKAARQQEKLDKLDWIAASLVRQRWIREQLLTRKVMPNGIALLTTQHFIGELFSPSDHSHRGTAADWLGAPEKRDDGRTMYYGGDRLQAYLVKHPQRYEHITAAIILAAMEDVIGEPKGDTKGWADNRGKIGPYLGTLAGWGYGLSDIEKRVIDQDAARAAKKAAS